MSVDLPARTSSRGIKAPVATVVCVLLVAIGLTWAFYSMRAVMNIGGACADGGPYVSAQPCPDGAMLIAIALPVMLISAMIGSVAAISINAPNLLIPMWGFLFGALGWNFLEFAFKGSDVVWSWLVCGVMFELMALPAIYAILVGIKNAVVPPERTPQETGWRTTGTTTRWWVPAYATLGAVGFLFGAWSWAALS